MQIKPVKFRSEVLLHEAIRALLSRMPSVKLAQITHGARELGKDILFYLPGGLGEDMLCACVIKNEPLTGTVGKSNAALTIIHQIEQCFLNPKVIETGETRHIKKVFVISPFDLTDAAIASITGHLQRTGSIEFVCGTRLFERFRQYWPDFLVDEFLTVREHLRRIKRHLEGEGPLENLSLSYQLARPDKTIARYYVYPTLTQTFSQLQIAQPIPTLLGKVRSLRQANGHVISHKEVEQLEVTTNTLKSMAGCLQHWSYPIDSVERLNLQFDRYRTAIRDIWLNRADLVTKGGRQSNAIPPVDISLKEMDKLGTMLGNCEGSHRTMQEELKGVVDGLAATVAAVSNTPEVLAHKYYPAALKLVDMHRETPGVLFDGTGKERTVTFSSTALDPITTSLLIAGPAGYGKTSFCRWHALRDAERFTNTSSEIIPAYFSLYEIGGSPLGTFEQLFLESVGQSALLPAEASANPDASYIKSRKIRLYLDGLDEMPSREKRIALMEILKKGLAKWRNVQAIITARDYIVEPSFYWLPRIQLAPFTDNDIRVLAKQWFDGDARKVQAFFGQATRIPELKKIMTVPLLATLVILLFRHANNLPANRSKLFSMFVDLLNEGWDLAKGVRRATRFGSLIKEAVLKNIAHQTHRKRTKTIGRRALLYTANTVIKTGADDKEGLLEELAQDGVISRIGDDFQFTHLSFQEFLTARQLIGDPTGALASQALIDFLRGDQWWKEVLCHYAGLSASAHELDNWITAHVKSAAIKDEELAREQANSLRRELTWILPGLK